MISKMLPCLKGPPKLSQLAAAVLVATLWRYWRRLRIKPKGVRMIPGHWLLGCLPQFGRALARNQVNELLAQLHESYGQTYALEGPAGGSVVITRNAKNVEHILLHNFQNYPKGKVMHLIFHDLLGDGIFNADGREWLHQRKTTSHMFKERLFKEHIWAVVQRNAKKTRQILLATTSGASVDVFNLLNRFTLDTIGEIGFGKSIGSLEDPSSPFLNSFDCGQQITFARFFDVKFVLKASFKLLILDTLGLGRFYNISERHKHHFATLDDYSRSVVRELRATMDRESTKAGRVAWADIDAGKSFVGLFVQDARKKGEELDEDYLRDLVLNFLIAGRDTTAQALAWTFFCLASNPDVEAKAREEVCEVCGTEDPSYNDIKSFPYLQAVLSEALRLYPSVPIDLKFAEAKDTWPDGTSISEGTLVGYNIYGMGRDPSVWGIDAEVFRPERWLEMKEAPNGYQYPVFNAGPRECLGKRLAMVEMKTCLAMVLPHLSLKLSVPADKITADSQLTIGMASGLPCFVEKVGKRAASHSEHSDCWSISTDCTDNVPGLIE